MSELLVSMCVISYNHEKFIRQALESVANQKVNFSTELIIADDCSRDGTAVIIEAFLKTYKGKSSFLKREKNIGAAANFIEMISTATGKYVAYLEGDDYWNSEYKIQKQVEFLEANPEIALSAHNSLAMPVKGKPYLLNRDKKFKKHEGTYTIENYIIKGFFHSSSIIYRRFMLPPFPDWYPNAFGGDNFLVLLLATAGGIHYINQPLSTYRINTDSISHYHSRFEICENFSQHFEKFNAFSNYKYSRLIKKNLFTQKFELHYYHPSYLKKLRFAFKNIVRIMQMDVNAFPAKHRIRILLPTFLLRSKINLFAKKDGSIS